MPEVSDRVRRFLPSLLSLAERKAITEGDLQVARTWLLKAQPGSRRVYHEGLLAHDRGYDPIAHALGQLLKWAETVGLVLLVQERIDAENCRYVAYRTGHVWQMPFPVWNQDGWRLCPETYDAMGVE